MAQIRHALGIDISTQTITAMLIGVAEENNAPSELIISSAWIASRRCASEIERKTPDIWISLIRECIQDLKKAARETEQVEAIGISTTFPGIYAVLNDGSIDSRFVSLYDNTDDAGACFDGCEEVLARAEQDTLNRIWPGDMAVGLMHLIKSCGLRLEDTSALLPSNSAFAYSLLRTAGRITAAGDIPSDYTQTVISGLYDAESGESMPEGVGEMMRFLLPNVSTEDLRKRLPKTAPSWRNIIPQDAVAAVRELLGLPNLRSVSIGAGDSPLGSLALFIDSDTITNVRGSSDSPMIVVDAPRQRRTPRETVLHYPMPTVIKPSDSPWCVVAPTIRSGKVWDWVRRLCGVEDDPQFNLRLEHKALEALKRRLNAPAGSFESKPLIFNTALGGERAPDWNPQATGTISGLVEAHGIGDIALAALEGMSIRLSKNLSLMEERYEVSPSKLLVVGGPAKNALWNWVTQIFTGKKTLITTFSDASLMGSALLGYAAAFDGIEDDAAVSQRLKTLSNLASHHPLVSPTPVAPPDDECAALEEKYREQSITSSEL